VSQESAERSVDLRDVGDHVRLFGTFDRNLTALEATLGVSLHATDDRLVIAGEPAAVARAERTLRALVAAAREGAQLTPDDVVVAAGDRSGEVPRTLLRTGRGRDVRARTPGQQRFVDALLSATVTFGIGPAGTGKTFLAVAAGLRALKDRRVSRLVLARPAVEAGERLGFLPGDPKEKIDPYLRPLYDALHELLDDAVATKFLERGTIEVAPLAYLRGRTLAHAFVILDEAQNATVEQMKMVLTRLGEGSRMAIVGDITQIDLPEGTLSGLLDARERFAGVPEIAVVELGETDIVRHPLVAAIVRAYAERPAHGRRAR
jgi:phosphate starvation-inducible PhoH-like protein